MTIKAHFDGKTFVPDEPATLTPGQAVEVHLEPAGIIFTGGSGATVGELLRINATGGLSGLLDPKMSSQEIADSLLPCRVGTKSPQTARP
jgi:hypothetical protein